MTKFSQATKNAHSFWNVMDDGPMFGQVKAYDRHLVKAQATSEARRFASMLIDTSQSFPPASYRRMSRLLNRNTALAS